MIKVGINGFGQIEAFDAVIAVPAGAGGKPEGRTVRAAIET